MSVNTSLPLPGRRFPGAPGLHRLHQRGRDGATGLLNFEAGQTTCFIPMWVHEDTLAEETEYFNVELERVTEGIASVNQGGAVASQRVNIEDQTPTVTLEQGTLVLSEGVAQTVTATLSRPNDTGRTLHASLGALDEAGDTANGDITPLPSRGQVDSDTVVGGHDFFLLGRDDGGSINERIQFGVEDDDRVKLADASGDRVWLAGESAHLYERNDSGGVDRTGSADSAPFVLTADRTGSVQGVLHPNELEDESGIATVQALTVSGNNAILAGRTRDDTAYLMALRYADSQDEDEAPLSRLWRVNISDAQGVIDMDYFRNRKVIMVLDADGEQVIRLYDRNGNRLTQNG